MTRYAIAACITFMLSLALCVIGIGSARAQQIVGNFQVFCPTGLPLSDPRCIRKPIDQGVAAPKVEEPMWEKHWVGAVAEDLEDGQFYATTGKRDPLEAELAAVDGCRKRGGKRCVVRWKFSDMCAAVFADRTNAIEPVIAYAHDEVTADKYGRILCRDKGGSQCEALYVRCAWARPRVN